MAKSPLMEIILSNSEDIADGMRDPKFQRFPWGSIFSWKHQPLYQSNFVFLSSIPDSFDDFNESIPDGMRLYTPIKLNTDKFELTSEALNFLYREKKKLRAPFLPEYTISNYDLESRNYKINPFDLTKVASKLIDKNSEDEEEALEQYLSAIIHMRSGRIWIMEDADSNIIASIVTSQVENSNLVILEYYQVHHKYRRPDLLKHLITHVISHHGKNSASLIICKNSDTIMSIAMELEFEIREKYFVYQIKK